MTESSHAPQFDTGPLSWVMSEIRDALDRSKTALQEAAARSDEAQATSLQHAKAYLHQAHGALQMVDVEGMGVMTSAAEEALNRFKEGTLACTPQAAQLVAEAYQAVVEYLEELMSGAPQQPARLFPYYRAIQELLGAARVHPADLFYVDLALPVRLPEHAAPAVAPDYAACRARFEKALLPFLKAADADAQRTHAGALREAIALVADAQEEAHARTFWLAMESFADMVAGGQLASDLYVKQLFGLINLQIRRLHQGQGSLPEAMLRDALFFIAAAHNPPAGARALRRAYGLEGVVPSDYDSRRYGRIDNQALKEGKEALAQAKHMWDRLAVGIDPSLEKDFQNALMVLETASGKLGAPALAQLARELGRVVKDSIASGRSDQFRLEMATALLFVEHGLDRIRQLPEDFDAHAEVIGARLLALAAGETPADAPQWQGDLSRQIQQGQTVTVLAAELKNGLRQVEKVLDDYYVDSSKRATLGQIDPVLYQLQGALAILDQDAAMRAAMHVKDAVKALAASEGNPDLEAASLQNIAQNIGALGFFTDMLGQNFESAKDRFTFDETDGMFREVPFEKAAPSETPFDLEDEPAAPVAAIPVPPPSAPVPMPAAPAPIEASVPGAAPFLLPESGEGDAAIEAELLEIFIMEAQEVLELVGETLKSAHAEPSNQETLTVLRRSFHTLKGSGRMVGLNKFGEGAHAVEKVMNLWLSESRSASPALLALLGQAAADMTVWVNELASTGKSARSSDALVAAAGRVQEGGPFEMSEAAEAAPEPVAELTDVVEAPEAPPEPELPAELDDDVPEVSEVIEMTLPDDEPELELVAAEPPPEPEEIVAAPLMGNVIEFPGVARTQAPDDNTKRIGELEIPLPLYNIYLAETDELMRVLTQDFGEWRHEPARAVTPEALKAAHTLAGTSATVGFTALREIAYALEMALKMLAPPAPLMDEAQRDLLDEVIESARVMLQSFALGELAAPQPALVARLGALREQLANQEAASAYAGVDGETAGKLDTLFASTLEGLLDTPPVVEEAFDVPLEAKAADPAIDAIDNLFEENFDPVLEAPAPTVAGVDTDIDHDAGPDLAPELITEAEVVPEPEPQAAMLPGEAPAAVSIETVFSDDLDADLLPVFLEEATDLLPQIGNGLRQWQQNPADVAPAQMVLRTLHTVKGSARMAGAMRLGQHTHEIETQIENMVHAGTSSPAAFDDLLANYDQALVLFEQLQSPQPEAAQAAAAPGQPAVAGAAPAKSVDDSHAAQARTPLVRVRADILDRLVNQAGEVSITRSKLENQVGTLRSSLFDFTDNLARLRRQLREVEMQAESQIASRMSISSEREFDPLEFDRFTRLQELTRMMAESVNDVASFHESLTRTVDGATDDLTVQSRLTRDLQRDLMRVRMVPFASLSERLFRVARQTAKEVDKRVNLDLRGGTVEIDRSVLEQMAAPFEHLLRNAIVHGIESREKRLESGKADTGELLIQVSQQGNEVLIEFTDDGAGLDLDRIRAKARSNGLLAEGAQVTDAEAADLIFEPGFSTAEALTELAGRGVGMDVVRSEAQALGGRVTIKTDAGKGARFTINLPLTLAVTQVVLTTSGGRTFALPSILVEQVLQVKEAKVQEAHAAGLIEYGGHKIALHYLPTLLGDGEARPLIQRSHPVLILKHGADRLAVHVDDIQGNREVVIKNIGPQLSRMIGIAGATVLGSGDIVLILNPVALSHHMDHHPDLRPKASLAVAAAAAVESRSKDAVVMVVDDSLTVRKVTQRMLEREGYQVILAKDGVDALEKLQEQTPDLMLVDIEMPRMDGFDLTRNIRGNDSTQNIPIIMITSRTADKHRNYALDLGVNAYFGKPFQEDVLVAAIAGLLNREFAA
jgi:chemosensory pili system protein ChpA (sensor histidine kinase/response regulator)